MGRFSGKFDLEDLIEIYGGFEKFKGTKIFIGSFNNPLIYETQKDLMPYYPYVEISGFHDNKNANNSTILLTEKSWVDIENERYGESVYRNKLKKNLEKYIEEYEKNKITVK